MNFKNFTSTIAAALATGKWSADHVEIILQNKLPRKFHQQAAEMADDLLADFPKSYTPSVAALARSLANLPVTRKIWTYARKNNLWPAASLTPASFVPSAPFTDFNLPALSDTDQLANWLGISAEMLVRFADKKGLSNRTDNAFAPHYRYHFHEKSNGGLRLIEEPKPMLKSLQRRILADMLNLIPPSPSAHGFTRGRDCLTAAVKHAGEEMVLCFDLKSFFPSVPHARIFGLFRTLGYPGPVAQDLTGLTTVATPPHVLAHHIYADSNLLTHRHLPQGAPTSPALANLAAFNLDRRLAGLAQRFDARYTRYADDMTFSGPFSIERALKNFVPQIIHDEGFTVNPLKTRTLYRHQQQRTTGLIVNEKINIPRQDFDRLKATIHHLKRLDNPHRKDPHYLTALSGRITWVERVNPARGRKLRENLAHALSR